MATIKYIAVHSPFHEIFTARERNVATTTSAKGTKLRKANLCARKRERIKIPNNEDNENVIYNYHISEFLNQPSGVEAIMNTGALPSFQSLESNLYRCTLPKLQLLNFEVAPVIDLHVIPTSQDCVVENSRWYLASWRVLMHSVPGTSTFQIYMQPFVLLPTSAVEGPGNIMIQALVDQLVPLMLQMLLQDYENWVHQQLQLRSAGYN